MSEAARQYSRNDDSSGQHTSPLSVVAAETLRSGSSSSYRAVAAGKGDERISLFWRIFGGTILSLVGLVVITAYQQLSSSINELRAELARQSEARSDLVKKDELNTRAASVWSSIKDLQTATNGLSGVREREAIMEQCMKTAQDERKEMAKEIQLLRERVAALESKRGAPSSVPPNGEGH
ncbi:MAG TPA: hypothetical protein VGG61_05230 [Gemmataceae bacterium]